MSDITKSGIQFTPTFYQSSTVTVSPTTRVNGPSLAVLTPPTVSYLSELKAGEALDQFDPCYIKSDGKVYRSLVNILAPPAAPTCTNTADGTGLWNGQALLVTMTIVTAQGESTPSIPTLFKITTTGQLHIAAYTGLDATMTSMNVYIGNLLWLSVPATSAGSGATAAVDISGATPTLGGYGAPSDNKAFKDGAWRVDGFCELPTASGEACTLLENVEVTYGDTNAPTTGAFVYLSVNAGQIANAKATNATGQSPIGKGVSKPDPISSGTQNNLILWALRK